MQCIVCKKQFNSKRATARYCSVSCRKLAFLKKDGTLKDVSGTLTNGTLRNANIGTLTTDNLNTPGKPDTWVDVYNPSEHRCKYCGRYWKDLQGYDPELYHFSIHTY